MTVRDRMRAGEAEEVAAMERDFLKSVLAVKKLEAEVSLAVQQVWRKRSSLSAAIPALCAAASPIHHCHRGMTLDRTVGAQVSAQDSQEVASIHGFELVEQKVHQLTAAVAASRKQLAEQKAAFEKQHALCKVSAGICGASLSIVAMCSNSIPSSCVSVGDMSDC